MNKKITVIRKSDPGNSGYVPGTPAERMAMVWPLTLEAVSLSGKYNAEQPLQRHIVNIIKKNKRSAGRTKDLADVEELEKLSQKEM